MGSRLMSRNEQDIAPHIHADLATAHFSDPVVTRQFPSRTNFLSSFCCLVASFVDHSFVSARSITRRHARRCKATYQKCQNAINSSQHSEIEIRECHALKYLRYWSMGQRNCISVLPQNRDDLRPSNRPRQEPSQTMQCRLMSQRHSGNWSETC